MPKQYENQEGLLVLPGTNQCAGYIFNFTGHGAYDPTGLVKTDTEGPTEEEVKTHNAILAKSELDWMIEHGKGTLYLSRDSPKCTPDNPRWQQENAGTWHYSNYRVGNWAGTWKSPHCYVNSGYSYGFCYVETFWVWFTGPDGKQWYGVCKGDQQCFNVRRLKTQPKKGH